jgi:hypothetical protein
MPEKQPYHVIENRPRDHHDVELRLAKLEGKFEATEEARKNEIASLKDGSKAGIDNLKSEMDKRFSSVDDEFAGMKEEIKTLGETVTSNSHKLLTEIQSLTGVLSTEKAKILVAWKVVSVVATVIASLGGAVGFLISETSLFK